MSEALDAEAIGRIYSRFSNGCDPAEDFRAWFGMLLDEATLNHSHQFVLVAPTEN